MGFDNTRYDFSNIGDVTMNAEQKERGRKILSIYYKSAYDSQDEDDDSYDKLMGWINEVLK